MDNELQSCNQTNLPAEATQDPIVSAVANLDLSDKDRRDLIFMLHIIVGGMSPTAAGKKVGLHECSGARLWQSLNDVKQGRSLMTKFIESTQATYRAKNALKLDRISSVESKIIDLLEAQPELAAKFPSFFRQVKTVGGVLADPVPVQPVININQVSNLMLNVGNEGK